MAESSHNRLKTLGKKEELLFMNNFSFSQCFQKTLTADIRNQGLFGKGIMHHGHMLTLSQTSPGFLAHLSTTCSGRAIVTGHRPASVHLSVR